jgi:hypothetical protein
MRFHEITSISGMGGLFRMDVQRKEGLIVTSLAEKWTRLVSSRKHAFTPLDNIAIYTDDDTVPLLDVMLTMREKQDKLPVPGAKASADDYKDYMAAIVPGYDREKVYVSDMKKLVRWYGILEEHGVLEEEIKARAEAEAESASAEGETAAEAKSDSKSDSKGASAKKPASKASTATKKAPLKGATPKAAKGGKGSAGNEAARKSVNTVKANRKTGQ